MTPPLEASLPAYAPHDPSQTLLYQVVAAHLETFLASLDADPGARGLPAYVEREFYDHCHSKQTSAMTSTIAARAAPDHTRSSWKLS